MKTKLTVTSSTNNRNGGSLDFNFISSEGMANQYYAKPKAKHTEDSADGVNRAISSEPECSLRPTSKSKTCRSQGKFQAMFYHIRPPTTALTGYAIGLCKQSLAEKPN